MRIFWALPLLAACASAAASITASATASDGCPPVRFSSLVSAPLLPTPNTHRVLVKQSDGSFTAFDLSNDPPYGMLHAIPHFDRQLRPCTPSVTGLNRVVLALGQTPSGGYLIASQTLASNVVTNVVTTVVTAFDADFNMQGQTTLSGAILDLQFADINNDGIPDIVTFSPPIYGNLVSVYLGNGGGSFQSPVTTSFSGSLSTVFTIADVNEDRKPDLVVVTGLPNAVLVLLGNGDGTFQAPKTAAPAIQPTALAVGDLNGDGKPDMVFADIDNVTNLQNSFEPIVAVALGLGDGTFSKPVQYAVGEQGRIAIGDLNGDGFPDIVTAGFTILFGDGKGGFAHRRDYPGPGPAFSSYPSGAVPIIADFDGDGIPDIVSAMGNSSVMAGDTVSVLFGKGGGIFNGPPMNRVPGLPAPDNQISALAAGDFNGDGVPDLAVADFLGNISALKGAGDGTFSPSFTTQATNAVPTAIVLADFNRDGNLDIVTVGARPAAGVSVLLGKGDGTFQSQLQAQTPLQTPAPAGAFTVVSADFNGDGNPDLAVLSSSALFPGAMDSVQILLGNGDGSFSPGAAYPVGPGAISLVAGDFHGDGKVDLVAANCGTAPNYRDGNLALLSGKGDGTFAAPAILPLSPGNGMGPWSMIAADFNRDGKLDLAVSFDPGLAVLLGTGEGSFQAPVLYAEPAYLLFSGDLNGDGIPDLIATSVQGDNYLLGAGDGSFQSPVAIAGAVPGPTALADFNRDGKLDIADGMSASTAGVGVAALLNAYQPPPPVAIVSAANLAAGSLVPGSVATAFGNFSSNAGVTFTDAAGTEAPATLLYESPTQANFVIPAGLDAGPASVTIGSAGPTQVVLTPSAPQLLSVGQTGLAAAYATQISFTGAFTLQPVFTVQNGIASPVPIDVSAGPAYLTLFATGLIGSAFVQLNGTGVPATYIGPDPSVPGIQQINLLLPASLAGSGQVEITMDGSPVYFVVK
jgi:uncharacterized protein (TIGR03437 family)